MVAHSKQMGPRRSGGEPLATAKAVAVALGLAVLHVAADLFLRIQGSIARGTMWTGGPSSSGLELLVHATAYGLAMGSVVTILAGRSPRLRRQPGFRSWLYHWLLAVTYLAASHGLIDGTKHAVEGLLVPQTLLFGATDQLLHLAALSWVVLFSREWKIEVSSARPSTPLARLPISLVLLALCTLAANTFMPTSVKLGGITASPGSTLLTAPARHGVAAWRTTKPGIDRYVVFRVPDEVAVPVGADVGVGGDNSLHVGGDAALHLKYTVSGPLVEGAQAYVGLRDSGAKHFHYWSTTLPISRSASVTLPLSAWKSSSADASPGEAYLVIALGSTITVREMRIQELELRTGVSTHHLLP